MHFLTIEPVLMPKRKRLVCVCVCVYWCSSCFNTGTFLVVGIIYEPVAIVVDCMLIR
jgi:hypothetical protein